MSDSFFEPLGTEGEVRENLRMAPYSNEAENSLLGSFLLDPRSWDLVSDKVLPEHFYRHEHRLIYQAMTALAQEGLAVDVVSVFERLQRMNQAQEAGGLPYLNALAQFVPNSANILRYCDIVREYAILRKMRDAGNDIVANATNPGPREITELLAEAEQQILKIGQEATGINLQTKSFPALVADAINEIQEMADSGDEFGGVPTGYVDVDRMTNGLHPGDLLILAARPAMGKTSLALNIAENVALAQGLPVVVFSMEMGAAQLTKRILSSVSRVDQTRLRTAKLNDDDWSRLVEGTEKLRNVQMEIDETPGMTIAQMRAAARRYARRHGQLGLVVVDYIQLMSGSNSGSDENRVSQLAEISRGLKFMAKELGCTVLALSQLNRGVETRGDKRPLMSDLRESGALEQDADLIWFIYRDDYYNKDQSKEPGVAELIIAKHRNGPTGTVKLTFIDQLTRFENIGSL